MPNLTAIVTILSLLFYFWTSFGVATARRASGIDAPVMTGHPQLDRAVRVHMNTLEWMPIYLPSLWIFALYFPMHAYADTAAFGLGVVWMIGRFVYKTGYMADPAKRSTGFMIQALTCLVLMIGGLTGAVMRLVAGG